MPTKLKNSVAIGYTFVYRAAAKPAFFTRIYVVCIYTKSKTISSLNDWSFFLYKSVSFLGNFEGDFMMLGKNGRECDRISN